MRIESVTLILMPGMDGTGDLFAGLLAALPQSVRTVTATYSCEEPLSYAELADQVSRLIPAAGPFVLVAESFSTPLAVHLAASASTNLAGVVLCAGFLASPLTPSTGWIASGLAPLLFRFPAPAWAIRSLLLGASASDDEVARVQAATARVKPAVLVQRLRSILGCDARESFRRLTVPTLILHPTHDRLLRHNRLGRDGANSSVLEVEGPHLYLQREPVKAAKAIVDFVVSLP